MTDAAPEYHPLLPATLTAPAEHEGGLRRSTRDWAVDSLCFLLGLGFAVLVLVGQFSDDGAVRGDRLAQVLNPLVGTLAVAALWVRRRWPVALALTFLPVAELLGAALVPALVMLFTVAVHRTFVVAAAVLLVGLLGNALSILTWPRNGHPFWVSVLIIAVIMALVTGWGMIVRARRQLVVSLRDRTLRAEAEQRLRVARAQHLERTRIAREMHDVLGHRISLLSLHAGALRQAPGASPEEVARAAGVIRSSAHAALQDLRQVIGVLRADSAEGEPDLTTSERPLPTLTDVPALVEAFRDAGMRVDLLDRVTDPEQVPDPVGRAAYRIAQEGLTNAHKHAPGVTVTVELSGGPGAGLTVRVHNPRPVGGRPGTTRPPGSGTGLVGVAERVTLTGGRVEHGHDPAGGHRLTATLPWPARKERQP